MVNNNLKYFLFRKLNISFAFIIKRVRPRSPSGRASADIKRFNTPRLTAEGEEQNKSQVKGSPWGLIPFIILLSLFSIIKLNPLTAEAASYKAQRIEQNYPFIINATSGKAFTFWVKFKNTGTATWYNSGSNLVALDVSDPYGRKSPFQHQWWIDWYCPARLLENRIRPGEIGTFRFAMQVPEVSGLYSEKFQIAAKDIDWIPGGTIEVIIRVNNPNYRGKPFSYKSAEKTSSQSQKNSSNQKANTQPEFNPKKYPTKNLEDYPALALDLELATQTQQADQILFKGPDIRIGLYSTEDPIVIRANGSYSIKDKDNKLLVKLTKGEGVEIEFNFDKLRYYLSQDGKRLLMTDSYLRFIPKKETNIFEIVSNKNTKTWPSYTKFKGKLETRYTDDKSFWLINELSMEDYLKGMAETGNENPQNYLKAMAVAERTYALYHLLNPTKHEIRNFTLTSNAGDQVYRGYSRELISPNVAEAVESTKGLVVTYNNEVVVTPYSARSNGMTKSWEEVWGGSSKPWLQPKYVPYDAERKFINDGSHGVGISAWGAWDMAKNRGYNFEEILKYFYTDVELGRVY